VNLSLQQQKEYIEAMGVDSWYPRVSLANALPVIQQAPISDDSSDESVQSEQVLTQDNSVVSLNPIQVEAQPIAVPVTDLSKAANSELKSEKPIRFGLALYAFDDWLVVSSLVPNYLEQNDAATRLLTGMMKSLGLQKFELKYHHVISWPFFSNPNASQGAESALQYVNGVIEHLVEEHKAKKLLVCGGVLSKLKSWDEIEGVDYGLERLLVPSLYKMIEEPALKAKAWSVMKNSKFMK
jgi:hypothetical protein